MHAKLRPFDYHGVSFRPVHEGDTEARGECPFCSHESQKFYVNLESGQYNCKHCNSSGNIYTFLTHLHDTALLETTKDDYTELADHRRGVPWALLRDNGFAVAHRTPTVKWLIPTYNIKNHLSNLRTYVTGKPVFGTAGLGNQLWRLNHYRGTGTIFLCEGEWDTLALERLRLAAGIDCTVLGVPGASQFKQDWLSLFQSRDVVICFDNDAPGENGAERTANMLKPIAQSIRVLRWPPDTADGWDVRDTVIQELDESKRDPVRVWRDFEKLLQVPVHLIRGGYEPGSPSSSEEIELPKCESFRTLLKHFKESYHVDNHMADGLAIIMATLLSIQLPGDPLWLFIVAPPGSGKTMFLTSTMRSKWTVFRSSLTPKSLISGYRSDEGDPSLIPQLTGKVLVLKDYTEIISMNREAQEEIYAILRGAYDGNCEKTFGNGITRTYHNCHFAMIAGVTDVIYGDDRASLGERFIKYQLVSSMEVDVTKHILAAITGMARQVEVEQKLQLLVAGFLNRDITAIDLPPLPDAYLLRVVALSQIISHLRATVPRVGRNDELAYRPSPEVGTRLAKQLVKLGQCLAVVYGKSEVDEQCWKLMKQVALDTARGWNLDVFQALAKYHPKPRLREQISHDANISGTTCQRRLDNLRLLGTVQYRPIHQAGPGQPPHGWTLSPDIAELWNTVNTAMPHTGNGKPARAPKKAGRKPKPSTRKARKQ